MPRAALKPNGDDSRYRLLLDAITDYAIYMLDAQGRVSSWNAGAERFKGYTAPEILGQHFSRFYTNEDRASGLPQTALRTAESEGRFEHEGWRVRKDGSHFWASVIVDPIRDEAGQLIGFAKVTRDITEKRDAQRALERAQEELLQARKMEALGQLAGGIAHDFNNLLMAISGSLELLKKRVPDDPRIARLLDNALQGAHRGAALTARMLAFSRRQPLEPQAVDLPDLARGLGDLLRLSMGGNIAIETRAPPSVPSVLVDPNQLELALLNIAANARDAMPLGGTLSIGISSEDVSSSPAAGLKPGPYVRLSISDTGEGMDEATLARAVDPFFTTKGPGKGTGLGLSVVHGLLEGSGGRLVLKSAKGEGTTVELWLPVAPSLQAAEPMAAAVPAGEALTETPLTVLAVDDDELVLMNTVTMLKDLGYRAIEAHSGAEALQRLAEGPVDLVITDQGMPRMTGIELATAARQTYPDLPVILATGYLELPRDPSELGLPKLAKPFSLNQLQAIIHDTMK